jgi:GT2 family glycosyltransferase
MRQIGANSLRLYDLPPVWLLDEAQSRGLKVFLDVPWEKHRCFFEDYSAQRDALRSVAVAAADLGNHPATFALSVANEIPKDIVRFYGARRVEQFIGELVDAARQKAPSCLVTYTNYPSTEFLSPRDIDFLCFNVYLNETGKLGPYLDRLQHLAGSRPLVLGELGLDSIRHGQAAQATLLSEQLRSALRRGLAGAFVFSFTDEWFTGGHRIEDWAFGVTDSDRREKPAAEVLRLLWTARPSSAPNGSPLPGVSVVVCSYNGAATLEECLRSLIQLDYPDYEVILVDDGSTDQTPRIASQFPGVRYVRQENRGLSAARNVGAKLAGGRIVAYTDSDCVADPMWLHFLVTGMMDQQVEAIGGPNIPPPCDGAVAACVAASPGGPSHVMVDDRYAEHVPGCNMAFDRECLLKLGGFDKQFRVAGDDVDMCWRFLDAGLKIGFSPAAVVWHHRRNTVRGYLRQQKGYGRAEAMLYFKHPQRFNAMGQARWNGVIYGEGAAGLPLAPRPIWHGRFGTALFQVVYPHNRYSAWAWPAILEWHLASAMLLLVGLLYRPLAVVGVGMVAVSVMAVIRSARSAVLPSGTPLRYRLLVALLHLVQPVIRAGHRYKHRLEKRRICAPTLVRQQSAASVKRVSACVRDIYWRSSRGRGREELLTAMVNVARTSHWNGFFDAEWETWDAALFGGWWYVLYLRTASEQLGGLNVFTRVRCTLRTSRLARLVAASTLTLTLMAISTRHDYAAIVTGGLLGCVLAAIGYARHRCWDAFAAITRQAAQDAGLDPVELDSQCLSAGNRPITIDEPVEPAQAAA